MIVILKLILNFSYFLYRIFYWNRKLPKVKNITKNLRYGRENYQKLDVIEPLGNERFPIIVYFHGGGFISSDKSNFTRICCDFSSKGFLIFNVNYGLSPNYKYPSQLNDVMDAISWIYGNSQKFNGDISRVYLAGDSSGAYLVALYISTITNRKILEKINTKNIASLDNIKGLILFYGAFDFELVLKSNFPLKYLMISSYLGKDIDNVERLKISSPAQQLNNKYPPTFICASENDPLYDESVNMYRKLSDNNIYCKSLFFSRSEFPDAGHGFLNFYKKKCSQIAMRESYEFILSTINLKHNAYLS